MNLDERLEDAKARWQSHDESYEGESAESPMSEAQILNLVKQQSKAFDAKIRRRDRRESIAAVLVFLFFSLMLLDPSWMVRAGALIVMASSAFVYWTLRRTRTRHATSQPGRPVADVLRAERTKVEAQIRLLENILWWYIAPLAIGVVLVVAGDEGASWFTFGYAAFVVILGGVIYYLNQRAVRRDLRPRREELTRLLQQVEE